MFKSERESYKSYKQAILFKMKKPSMTSRQRQWIEGASQTFADNTEALGYSSIDGHSDKVVNVIKDYLDYIIVK